MSFSLVFSQRRTSPLWFDRHLFHASGGSGKKRYFRFSHDWTFLFQKAPFSASISTLLRDKLMKTTKLKEKQQLLFLSLLLSFALDGRKERNLSGKSEEDKRNGRLDDRCMHASCVSVCVCVCVRAATKREAKQKRKRLFLSSLLKHMSHVYRKLRKETFFPTYFFSLFSWPFRTFFFEASTFSTIDVQCYMPLPALC